MVSGDMKYQVQYQSWVTKLPLTCYAIVTVIFKHDLRLCIGCLPWRLVDFFSKTSILSKKQFILGIFLSFFKYQQLLTIFSFFFLQLKVKLLIDCRMHKARMLRHLITLWMGQTKPVSIQKGIFSNITLPITS